MSYFRFHGQHVTAYLAGMRRPCMRRPSTGVAQNHALFSLSGYQHVTAAAPTKDTKNKISLALQRYVVQTVTRLSLL
jgi:hypothetical protein